MGPFILKGGSGALMAGKNVMDILHRGMGFQPFLPRGEAFWPLFQFLGRKTTSPASVMILWPRSPPPVRIQTTRCVLSWKMPPCVGRARTKHLA